MSYRTEADEKLTAAAKSIREAISALSAICVEACEGHDDYTAEYVDKIERAFDDLRRIRKDLNR